LGFKKKLRIGFSFGETVGVEGPVRMLLTSGFQMFLNKPALELSERPALIFWRGRITVDAREKD
jgi:hypothetical protein